MKSFSKYAVLAATAVAAVAILAVPKAYAGPIMGTIYQGVPDSGNAGDPANMTSSLANATFNVGPAGINFSSGPSPYTAAGFLNNPTFSNQMNGFSSSATIDNSEVVLNGSVNLMAGLNTLVFTSDDGSLLTIGGNTYGNPGPQSATPTTVLLTESGPTTLNFTLDYAECCGAPAVLDFTDNGMTVGAVPEPNSLVLMGTGGILLLGAYGLAAVKMGGNA